MAKVIFSSLIDAITGKVGGSVFQLSNGGYQLRNRTSPRNPTSGAQQNRRAAMSDLLFGYQALSVANRATWLAPVGTYPDGIKRFTAVNNRLHSAAQPALSTFTGTGTLTTATITITSLTNMQFVIAVAGVASPVPANNYYVIAGSPQLPPGVNYVSPACHKIFLVWPPAFDYSINQDIINEYTAVFGALELDRVIQLSLFRINAVTGDYSVTDYSNVDSV